MAVKYFHIDDIYILLRTCHIFLLSSFSSSNLGESLTQVQKEVDPIIIVYMIMP